MSVRELDRPVHARDAQGAAICGAKRQRGGICQQRNLASNGRCNSHGGRATGRPLVAGGEHSLAMQRLRAECDRLARDEAALLNTLPIIAKMHEICARLEARVEQGDVPELRKRALEHFDAARDASARKDPNEAALQMNKGVALLREGVSADSVLEGWAHNLERLAKRIEATVNTRIAKDRALSERDMQKILVLWLGLLLEKYDDDPYCLAVISEMRRGLEAAMGSLYPRDVFLDPKGPGQALALTS